MHDSWLCVQEAPQFVLFSTGEKGGAAQVRNILNRAVGAQENVIRQVRYLSADILSLCTQLGISQNSYIVAVQRLWCVKLAHLLNSSSGFA